MNTLPLILTTYMIIKAKSYEYYPNFFEESFYDQLLEEIDFEQHTIRIMGKELAERHLGSSHSFDEREYNYSGSVRKTKPMTPTLLKIHKKIQKLVPVDLNYVHCNFYRDGNDSIGYHSDSEKDLLSPYIVSVSFGASRKFRLRKHGETSGFFKEFVLNDGDVLIMKGNCQKKYKHCVPVEKKVKDGRINLTFRVIRG